MALTTPMTAGQLVKLPLREVALEMRIELSGCPEGYEKSNSLENRVIF